MTRSASVTVQCVTGETVLLSASEDCQDLAIQVRREQDGRVSEVRGTLLVPVADLLDVLRRAGYPVVGPAAPSVWLAEVDGRPLPVSQAWTPTEPGVVVVQGVRYVRAPE